MWQTAGGWLDFNPSTHADAHLACRLCKSPPHTAADMALLFSQDKGIYNIHGLAIHWLLPDILDALKSYEDQHFGLRNEILDALTMNKN